MQTEPCLLDEKLPAASMRRRPRTLRWRPSHTGIHRAAAASLIVAFAALICLPAWKTYRDLLTMPRDDLSALKGSPIWRISRNFPGQFEALFDVYFGFRRTLLSWLRHAKIDWFGASPSTRVVLGKDGWLYYVPMPVGADYPTAGPFTSDHLERWARMLQERRDWLAARGIPYVVMIAPDKQTIYPESLPESLRIRATQPSRLDQLLRYLREHTTVEVVDVRGPIIEAKARERLYDLTDSHWNDRGAYVAYAGLVDALAPRFDGMAPVPRHLFADAATSIPGGDCARLIGLENRFSELSLSLVPREPRLATRTYVEGPYAADNPLRPFAMERSDAGLPRAVMFHDSFGAHLIPYLSEHFRRIVYAWERPDYPVFDGALVERERPDVVIQQIVERKLAVYFPRESIADDPRCETPASWSRCSETAE
jgi:hypothetical protein